MMCYENVSVAPILSQTTGFPEESMFKTLRAGPCSSFGKAKRKRFNISLINISGKPLLG